MDNEVRALNSWVVWGDSEEPLEEDLTREEAAYRCYVLWREGRDDIYAENNVPLDDPYFGVIETEADLTDDDMNYIEEKGRS